MKSYTKIVEGLGIGNKFFDAVLNVLNLGGVPQKDIRSMQRFLFLQYDKALGSAINATPVFEALRRARPDAHIAMAASGYAYEVFKSNPHIDEIHETPHGAARFPKALGYFLLHMRGWRKAFDCVMTDSFNAHTKMTILQIATGIPVRAGYANRSGWVHHPLVFPEDKVIRSQTSVIENNLRILDLLGQPCQPGEPTMFFDESDRLAGESLLRAAGVSEDGPLVFIVPQGSGGQPHIWFEDRFAQVGNRLFDLFRARLVFAGAAYDAMGIERIRHQMRAPSFSLAGKANIPQLAALLCKADFMLTMDTGVMHLGRAVRLPMVILTSASQTTKEWLPLGMDRYVVLRRDHVPCALCWKSFCATRECMDEISVEDVVTAMEMQFDRFPPSDEQRRQRLARALVGKVTTAAI